MTQRAERPHCAVNRGSSGWGLVCGDGVGVLGRVAGVGRGVLHRRPTRQAPSLWFLSFARGEGRSPGAVEGQICRARRWRAAGWRVDRGSERSGRHQHPGSAVRSRGTQPIQFPRGRPCGRAGGGGARPYKDTAPPSAGFFPLPGLEAARRPIAGEELWERPPPKGEARRRLLGGDGAERARAPPGTPSDVTRATSRGSPALPLPFLPPGALRCALTQPVVGTAGGGSGASGGARENRGSISPPHPSFRPAQMQPVTLSLNP